MEQQQHAAVTCAAVKTLNVNLSLFSLHTQVNRIAHKQKAILDQRLFHTKG